MKNNFLSKQSPIRLIMICALLLLIHEILTSVISYHNIGSTAGLSIDTLLLGSIFLYCGYELGKNSDYSAYKMICIVLLLAFYAVVVLKVIRILYACLFLGDSLENYNDRLYLAYFYMFIMYSIPMIIVSLIGFNIAKTQ